MAFRTCEWRATSHQVQRVPNANDACQLLWRQPSFTQQHVAQRPARHAAASGDGFDGNLAPRRLQQANRASGADVCPLGAARTFVQLLPQKREPREWPLRRNQPFEQGSRALPAQVLQRNARRRAQIAGASLQQQPEPCRAERRSHGLPDSARDWQHVDVRGLQEQAGAQPFCDRSSPGKSSAFLDREYELCFELWQPQADDAINEVLRNFAREKMRDVAIER
jgi:hypothetical protein